MPPLSAEQRVKLTYYLNSGSSNPTKFYFVSSSGNVEDIDATGISSIDKAKVTRSLNAIGKLYSKVSQGFVARLRSFENMKSTKSFIKSANIGLDVLKTSEDAKAFANVRWFRDESAKIDQTTYSLMKHVWDNPD